MGDYVSILKELSLARVIAIDFGYVPHEGKTDSISKQYTADWDMVEKVLRKYKGRNSDEIEIEIYDIIDLKL